MFDRYSTAAQEALDRAPGEAQALRHSHVGPEHLLLALIDPHRTGAGALLVEVHRPDVLRLIGEALGGGVSVESVAPLPNSQFRDVTSRAFREGLRRAHRYLTTEDLLLGILADGHNLGAHILNQLGVKLDNVWHRAGDNLWPPSPNLELADDVERLTKENATLQAAVAEMRPVFDSAVSEARKGKPARREWADQIAGRIGAGEFGEPRRLS